MGNQAFDNDWQLWSHLAESASFPVLGSATNNPLLRAFEPKLVLDLFDWISKTPRRSGSEAAIRSRIAELGKAQKWKPDVDDAGNIVLHVPGRGRGVAAAPVILQGHLDMVCVKTKRSSHDFLKDPIRLIVEQETSTGTGTRLRAEDTTLGADNGIGIAAALAIALDPSLYDCPPLELIFTVEEETTMAGAKALDFSTLKGTTLINLDSDRAREIFISGAGGRVLRFEWSLSRCVPLVDEVPIDVTLNGLPGGHNGVQVHERRGNSHVFMAHALLAAARELGHLRLASLDGGSAANAIPAETKAVVWIKKADVETLDRCLQRYILALQEEVDPSLGKVRITTSLAAGEPPCSPTTAEQTGQILETLKLLPNGVQSRFKQNSDKVETSTTLSVLLTQGGKFVATSLGRSAEARLLRNLQNNIESFLAPRGAQVTYEDPFPGWEPQPDSWLVKLAQSVFLEVQHKPALISGVHAGLECGIFLKKRPGLAMISIGPDIYDLHSTEERLNLDTLSEWYETLRQLLQRLSLRNDLPLPASPPPRGQD